MIDKMDMAENTLGKGGDLKVSLTPTIESRISTSLNDYGQEAALQRGVFRDSRE